MFHVQSQAATEQKQDVIQKHIIKTIQITVNWKLYLDQETNCLPSCLCVCVWGVGESMELCIIKCKAAENSVAK